MSWRHKLYPNYKKRKRRVHPDDVAPEVGHQQEVDKQQAIQDEDMEKGEYTQDPEQEDLSQQVNYSEKVGPDDIILKGLEEEKAKFGERDKAIEAAGKAKRKGYLTDEDYLDRLKDAARTPLNTILSHIEKPIEFGSDVWQDTKEWAPWYDVGGNIGALGARAIESIVPTTPQELAAELVEMKMAGAAYPAMKLAKEVPIVKEGLDKLDLITKRLQNNFVSLIKSDEILPDGTIRKGNQPLMIKGSKNPNQLNLLEKPIERFMTNKYKREVRDLMNRYGMGDGVFSMRAYDLAKGAGKFTENSNRFFLERYLSPDRLKGSFTGFSKANRSGFKYEWSEFLKSKGMTDLDIQAHHINPLYDSIHLFDGVKHNSSEYWDIIGTLVSRNARTGVIQRGDDINNLMMTLGKATAKDTPHGIAHKFYNKFTPKFFSKSEMTKIREIPGYRIKKAKRWATLVNKSEEIILEAHKQWSLLNPKVSQNLSFDELVEKLSKLNAKGYNKLISPEYQLPDMNNIIEEIAKDKGLKQIWKKAKPTEDLAKKTKWERIRKDAQSKKETKAIDKRIAAQKKESKLDAKNPKRPKQKDIDIK